MSTTEKKEATAIIDSLMAGAKSHYQGFGNSKRPSTFFENGYLYISPPVQEFLEKKDGYILLATEYEKIKGVDYIVGYYLKKSEYGAFPFTPQADENHRVYVFGYIRHKRTGNLTQGPYTVTLSPQETREQLKRFGKKEITGKEKLFTETEEQEEPENEVMEQYTDENGDSYCLLIPDGKTTPEKVYVAEAMWALFKGKIPPGMKVTHIDGNKANNDVRNLKLELISGVTR